MKSMAILVLCGLVFICNVNAVLALCGCYTSTGGGENCRACCREICYQTLSACYADCRDICST
jgi:hypothetical protein